MGGVGERILTAVLVTAIAAVAGSALIGADGVARLLQLRAQRQALGETAVDRMTENVRLRDSIDRLKDDPRHLEALARRELGLVRPDEIVYRSRRRSTGQP